MLKDLKITHYLLLILTIGLALPACEDSLKIENVSRTSKIVVNSTFSPSEDFSVHLSQSLGITQPGSLQSIENAEFTILDESEFKEYGLKHQELGFYLAEGFKPISGHTYVISVNHPGFPSVYARNQVPQPVESQLLKVEKNYRGGVKILDVTIEIKDRAEEHNYYLVKAMRHVEMEENGEMVPVDYSLFVVSNDPNTENDEIADNSYLSRIYLPDSGIDGQNYHLTFAVELYAEAQGGSVELQVQSVSHDLYEYFKGLEMFELYGDDPNFSSPIQIKNNIENGLGIFGAYTQQKFSISVEE